MLLAVWIAVPVLCLVVLAALVHGVLGALQRLGREAHALEREVAPLLARARAVQARATRPSGEQRPPPSRGAGSGRPPA